METLGVGRELPLELRVTLKEKMMDLGRGINRLSKRGVYTSLLIGGLALIGLQSYRARNPWLLIGVIAIGESLRIEFIARTKLNQSEEIRRKSNAETVRLLDLNNTYQAKIIELEKKAVEKKAELQGFLKDAIAQYEAQNKDESLRKEKVLIEKEARLDAEYEQRFADIELMQQSLEERDQERESALTLQREALIPHLTEELTQRIFDELSQRFEAEYQQEIGSLLEKMGRVEDEKLELLDEVDRLREDLNKSRRLKLPNGMDAISSQARRFGEWLRDCQILIDIDEAYSADGVVVLFQLRDREQYKRLVKLLENNAMVELALGNAPVLVNTPYGYRVTLQPARNDIVPSHPDGVRDSVLNTFTVEGYNNQLNLRYSAIALDEGRVVPIKPVEGIYGEVTAEEEDLVNYFGRFRQAVTGRRNLVTTGILSKVYGVSKGYSSHQKRCSNHLGEGQLTPLVDRIKWILDGVA